VRRLVGTYTILLLFAHGCAPISGNYNRIEAPDAVYFGRSCGGSVAPQSIVYFPYHGIFISMGMSPWIRFGIHLPAGTTAEVLGRTVRIYGETDAGPVHFMAQIKPTSIGSFGSSNPPEFMAFYAETYKNVVENYFGPFDGASKGDRHIWHLFSAFDESQSPRRLIVVPPGLVGGILELPALSVNGQKFDPVKLRFNRDSYRALAPINC